MVTKKAVGDILQTWVPQKKLNMFVYSVNFYFSHFFVTTNQFVFCSNAFFLANQIWSSMCIAKSIRSRVFIMQRVIMHNLSVLWEHLKVIHGYYWRAMNLEEFCIKILSFPLLAKFAAWKFHCNDYYKVSMFVKMYVEVSLNFIQANNTISVDYFAWWNVLSDHIYSFVVGYFYIWPHSVHHK